MAMRTRPLWALTATLALTLLSVQAGASPGATRAQARTASQAGGSSSYRLDPAHSAGPATSTIGPRADFNGDGFGDLAVGVPGEDVNGKSNAGGVNVLYGSSSGLASAGNQFWSQDSAGVLGAAETNDAFGQALAVGDFNHDGYSDLAVGVPFESVGAASNAGGVNILYGSASGLTSAGNQFWSQNSPGIHNESEPGDEFGFALAARDFNGDGYSDLAVGVPSEDSGSHVDEGAINVLYGSATGLTASGDQFIKGFGSGSRFGTALAAGNFDAAGGQDLAVGAPDMTNDAQPQAGMAMWLLGTPSGLNGPHFSLNTFPMAGEHCGTSLVSYNENNDSTGYADVAVGCPNATYVMNDEGAVDVHQGTSTGLSDGVGDYESPNIQADEEFGTSVAAGDFGRDGSGGGDDLVVGAPRFNAGGSLPDAGAAWIIFESTMGPSSQQIMQGVDGIVGTAEAGDIFGAAVTSGNFDGDGWSDVAIGVPGEGLGSVGGAGGVNVVYGSGRGVVSAGNQFWSQNTPGVVGVAEPEDFFGDAVSARNG